jgi:hypothetical protein
MPNGGDVALADMLERPRRVVEQALDSARTAYENLNERERKLVTALAGVLVAVVVLLPLYLMNAAIGDLEQENRDIAEVLRDIDRARPVLRQKDLERQAAMKLYENSAPSLGSFLEQKASEQGLKVREVTDQPEKDLGEYRRRHVRVTLPNVGLVEVVRMMAAVANSPYPVAIERVHIDHFRTGNQYNVQLGVVAFDRKAAGAKTATNDRSGPGARRARAAAP